MRHPAAPSAPRVVALALLVVASLLPGGSVAQQDPGCGRWRAAFAAMPFRMVTLQAGPKNIAVRAKAADTPERQAAGFQCATPQEIQQHLILFDFGNDVLTQFHMNNVPAPLDIAFAKADGRIFAILTMAPSPTALYGPMGPFRYALEARAGFYASQGIRQGEARLLVPASR
jgi:uncharacterized membrane protein (UPF0127 family)